MQAITAYKVLGGIGATSIITGTGVAIGRSAAIMANKTDFDIRRDAYIGGAIAAVPSTIIGLVVAGKPNLKSAGYTQAITSGLGLVGYSFLAFFTPLGALPTNSIQIAQRKQLSAGKVAGLVEYQVEAGYAILA